MKSHGQEITGFVFSYLPVKVFVISYGALEVNISPLSSSKKELCLYLDLRKRYRECSKKIVQARFLCFHAILCKMKAKNKWIEIFGNKMTCYIMYNSKQG